jgi:hypothetical protein
MTTGGLTCIRLKCKCVSKISVKAGSGKMKVRRAGSLKALCDPQKA